MRPSLLGFLLVFVLLVSSDVPGRFEPPAPVPGSALAGRNDEWAEDDEDEDDEDEDDDDEDGGEDDERRQYRRGRSDRYGGNGGGPYDRLNGGAAGHAGLAVTRGPYLQVATPSGITIRWRTSGPTHSLVRYGSSPNDLQFQKEEGAETTEHEVRLVNLRPDTRYFYSVGTSSSVLAGGPDCSFRTAPPVGSVRNVRIWIVGDSGLRGAAQRRVQEAYDAFSNGAQTDVWLLLGDNAYTAGTSQQYEAGFFGPYRTRLRSTVVWPARGNHDDIKKGPGNDFYDFFTLPRAGEAGGTPSGTEAYYSFDFANVHFVCLDAEMLQSGAGSAMMDWLRADLAATNQDWLIAYWHHPPYSKGSHDSDTDPVMTRARSRFLPVLEAGGVDLVLCGHSHSYERSFLLDGHYGPSGSLRSSMILDRRDGSPDGDGPYRKPAFGRPVPHKGAVYVVAGSASRVSGGPLNHVAHARSLNVLGSLVIDISGERLDATFVDDRRRVADRFTIAKGEGPSTVRGGRSARPRARGRTGTARAYLVRPPARHAPPLGARIEWGTGR